MQLELLSLDRITVKTDQRMRARNRKKATYFQKKINNMRESELLAHFIKILSRSFFLHSSEISASEKYCQMALSLKNTNDIDQISRLIKVEVIE